MLAAYALPALVVAFVPRPMDDGVTPWARGVLALLHRRGLAGWMTYEVVESALHVAAFVPIGILAVVALGRRLTWLAVVASLGLCALVESATAAAFGEPPSAADLVLNAVGVLCGAAIGYWALAPYARSRRLRRP